MEHSLPLYWGDIRNFVVITNQTKKGRRKTINDSNFFRYKGFLITMQTLLLLSIIQEEKNLRDKV